VPERGADQREQPVLEYMFLDNTACNLASLNVLKFYDPETRAFDVERYEHGDRPVDDRARDQRADGGVPEPEIAELSYKYRTLGLGYANLGAMLMQAGIPTTATRPARSARCSRRSSPAAPIAVALMAEGARARSPATRRTRRTCCA
jgi:hypothetical protein